MTRGLAKSDISDLDFVDAAELASDGQTPFLTSVTVVSTTSATKRVVVSGVYLVHDADQRVEPGDMITLSGTTGGADGVYTVDSVVDDVTLVVTESIVDSTGGSAAFTWPPGASRVGLDPTGLTHVTASNVQDAITDLDAAISAGGITEEQHESLDTIVHEIDETSYDEVTYVGSNVSSYIVWETSDKLRKIREELYTYSSGRVSTTVTKQYDSAGTLKMTMTESYTYVGGKVATITRVKS